MTGCRNRYLSKVKALRKRRIDHAVYHYDREYGFYNNLHQYSKNKIHCSCPICSAKTKNKGPKKRKLWAPSTNYKISDIRKINRLSYEED